MLLNKLKTPKDLQLSKCSKEPTLNSKNILFLNIILKFYQIFKIVQYTYSVQIHIV
jgi:hypothetical protein